MKIKERASVQNLLHCNLCKGSNRVSNLQTIFAVCFQIFNKKARMMISIFYSTVSDRQKHFLIIKKNFLEHSDFQEFDCESSGHESKSEFI